MEWLTLWRGIKAGTKNFFRNGWLSVATMSIIVLTLFIINAVMLITFIAKNTLEDIQQKIDVSVYLKNDATDNDAKSLIATIQNLPDVKEVRYTSKDDALESFKEKHGGDNIILQSLEELGNPLQPSISVKMNNPDSYQNILETIKKNDASNIISDVDYYSEKKPVVEKLNHIIGTLKKIGGVIVVIFSFIAILVTFNSIRLTMYNYKREVEIMKLVGANPWFIRLPFITEGILYGFFSAWISLLVSYPIIYFTSPYVISVIPNVNIIGFLKGNGLEIVFIQLLVGILLGAVSSLLAIRRYLKI